MVNRKPTKAKSTAQPTRTRVERLTEALESFNVACTVKVIAMTGVVAATPTRKKRIEHEVDDARAELAAALTEFTAPMLRVVGVTDGRK